MIKSSKRFVCYQRNLEFEFLRILLMLSNNFSTFFSKIQIQDSSTMFCSHQMFKRTKNIIIFIVTRLNIFVCVFKQIHRCFLEELFVAFVEFSDDSTLILKRYQPVALQISKHTFEQYHMRSNMTNI